MITFKAKDASGEIINSALSPFFFPAGEAHTKRNYNQELQPVEIAIFQPSDDSIHDDLFAIAMWSEYLAGEDHEIKSVLIMPYMPGARADRGLPTGVEVYAQFINSMLIDQIVIFDPHSQKTPQVLIPYDNLTVVYPAEFFEQDYVSSILSEYDGIIAPDAGAKLRAQGVADALDLPLFTATKTRNEETGKLSNFAIEDLDSDGIYLIVDDICDGGGTFKGLADASGLDWGQIDLYVSHGVFSKDALTTLGEYFENVYTTNSYEPTRPLTARVSEFQDEDNTFHRFDVIRLLLSKIKY